MSPEVLVARGIHCITLPSISTKICWVYVPGTNGPMRTSSEGAWPTERGQAVYNHRRKLALAMASPQSGSPCPGAIRAVSQTGAKWPGDERMGHDLARGEVVQRKSPFCRGHRENCEPAQTSPRSSKQLRAAGLRVQRVEGRNRVGCCREGGVTEEGLIFLFEKAQPKIHHYVTNRNNWAQDQVLKSLLWEAGMTLLWVASLHTEASLLFTSGLIPGK